MPVWVVGDSDNSAFTWQASTGIVDLNDLVPADSGWYLTGAFGINDEGQMSDTV
jgi:hypothetical protein